MTLTTRGSRLTSRSAPSERDALQGTADRDCSSVPSGRAPGPGARSARADDQHHRVTRKTPHIRVRGARRGIAYAYIPRTKACENAMLPDATREAASASATKTDCELVAQTSSSCCALRDVPGNTRPPGRRCQGIIDRVTCPRATRGGRS